jgi:hypothetical protein
LNSLFSGKPEAHKSALLQAKALAMMTVDIYCNPATFEEVKQAHQSEMVKL